MTPTLWIYYRNNAWYGHIDWKDGSYSPREGPFDTEAQASVVISRMYGMEPPSDMLRCRNVELR